MPSQSSKVVNHVHKLKKHKYKSGNITYFCTLPDCNYKVAPALAIGKRSICNRCGNEFILNEYSIRLVRPHCEECHKSKDGKKEIKQIKQPSYSGIDIGVEAPSIAIHNPFADSTLSLSERLKQATTVKEDEEIWLKL